MKIAIGCDHGGYDLKEELVHFLQEKGHEVKTGEIYPTNPAPILVWEERGVVPQAVKWGWPKFGTQK